MDSILLKSEAAADHALKNRSSWKKENSEINVHDGVHLTHLINHKYFAGVFQFFSVFGTPAN